jgi:hypothetical protein
MATWSTLPDELQLMILTEYIDMTVQSGPGGDLDRGWEHERLLWESDGYPDGQNGSFQVPETKAGPYTEPIETRRTHTFPYFESDDGKSDEEERTSCFRELFKLVHAFPAFSDDIARLCNLQAIETASLLDEADAQYLDSLYLFSERLRSHRTTVEYLAIFVDYCERRAKQRATFRPLRATLRDLQSCQMAWSKKFPPGRIWGKNTRAFSCGDSTVDQHDASMRSQVSPMGNGSNTSSSEKEERV